ncbi:piggyBac transposable element-derived protein 3-like [Hydra vulgaris]|uniref:PiggyBac transposable element-derived protein 3-like n=1 Tax=Hydra vulgaris TaxID=6087 RepID=A0ABM4BUY2_HYDVU
MAAFLGVNFIMSINVISSLESYWYVDSIIINTRIQNVTTRERYKSIFQNLHFKNNVENDKNDTDRAKKSAPPLKHFNKYFLATREDTDRQSIDEHMVKFKRRNLMKQYLKNKPIKWGFKFCFRCCSDTGYLYEFDI